MLYLFIYLFIFVYLLFLFSFFFRNVSQETATYPRLNTSVCSFEMLGNTHLLLHSNCLMPISVEHFDINRILILNKTYVYHNNNNDSDNDSNGNDNNNNNNNNISLNRYTILYSQRKYRMYSAKISCFSFLIRENIV